MLLAWGCFAWRSGKFLSNGQVLYIDCYLVRSVPYLPITNCLWCHPRYVSFHSNRALCADTILPYTVDTPTPPQPRFQYGGSYPHSALWAFQQEDIIARSPWDELWQYHQSDVEPETTTDILGWWGVSQYLLEFWAHTNGISPTLLVLVPPPSPLVELWWWSRVFPLRVAGSSACVDTHFNTTGHCSPQQWPTHTFLGPQPPLLFSIICG